MIRALGLALAGLLLWAADRVTAAEPVPVLFLSAPGRFEVAAIDPLAAQGVVNQCAEAWAHLAGPLALPEAFSSPVLVRLIPAKSGAAGPPFRVTVEAGGVVSVWLAWREDLPADHLRRALVQGLLMRLAVHHHGVTPRLAAPLWLEQAAVAWWRTRADPAQLDAAKLGTQRAEPPRLGQLLAWQRGDEEPPTWSASSLWLLTLLQADFGRGGEWSALLRRWLGGEEAERSLNEAGAGRWTHERERELWWQTGWQQLRRARVLPVLDAAESRAELVALSRFVFRQRDVDQVIALPEVVAHAREPEVDAELKARAATLARLVPALHPFYRNAGLSLAEVLAIRKEPAERRAAVLAAWADDWRDAEELAAATTAALDALERGRRTAPR